MRRGITLIEVIIILVIVFILAALLSPLIGSCGGCGEGYSEGDRTGVVVKLSRKGIWDSTKSWEAEMNMGGVSVDDQGSAVANVWKFTIEDEAILKKVQEAQRTQKKVTIHYTQWRVKPSTRSETGYFATEVIFHDPPKIEPPFSKEPKK